jgi:lysozyme
MRAEGIDISRYQSSYDPTVKAHDFVFVRAAYGTSPDTRFSQHVQSCADVPVVGAYQYFRSAQPWKAQADAFLALADVANVDVAILDVERYGNSMSMQFGDDARQWLEYVKERFAGRLLLYTNPATYQLLLQYGQRWMSAWDYWCAQYPYRGWNDQLVNVVSGDWQPRLPATRDSWHFWQYSADGNRKGNENGIAGWRADVDLNVFNGTRAELMAWAGKDESEPEPEPDVFPLVVEDGRYRVTVEGMG